MAGAGPARQLTYMRSAARHAWLWCECAVIYGALPLMFCHAGLRRVKLPALFALLMIAMLLASRTAGWRAVLRLGALRPYLRGILWRAALVAGVIVALTYWLRPEDLLRFPRTRPGIWALVMLLYPVLSAYPQELIYRTCFFRRYAPIFPSATMMLLASSSAFAWLHIVFWNVPAVVLSLLGGIMLSHTYQRSNSTLAVTTEHALYGCLLFTIGLGRYFYLPL